MVRLFTSKAKTEEELAVEFPEFAHELTEHVSVVMTRKTEMIMKGIKKNFEIILKLFFHPATQHQQHILFTYLFIDLFNSNNSIEIISIQYPKSFSPSFETQLYYPEERNSNERKSFERKN